MSVDSWRMPPVIWQGSAPRIPITSGLVQEVPSTLRTSPSYRSTWWISRDSSGSCRSSWTTRRTRKVEISEVCTTQTKITCLVINMLCCMCGVLKYVDNLDSLKIMLSFHMNDQQKCDFFSQWKKMNIKNWLSI